MPRSTRSAIVIVALLLSAAVSLQVWRDRGWQPYEPATPVLWLQNAPAMRRLALGFDSIIADVYWIRAVVYFGRQRLSQAVDKNYDLLYPFLDFVTTFDPRFTTAYRFGAIFLSERPPGGPFRPDLAVALLQRGLERSPERWEYAHDIGFVYYWSEQNYRDAAKWFEAGADIPGAPIWLRSTAASMLAQGDDRESARRLWRQMKESADNDWIARTADVHLAQFDALDAIDVLNPILWRYTARQGRVPRDWNELIRSGMLAGVPRDPAGVPFEIDPFDEVVRVSKQSPLWPMPDGYEPAARQ